jgi:hypothetical protein
METKIPGGSGLLAMGASTALSRAPNSISAFKRDHCLTFAALHKERAMAELALRVPVALLALLVALAALLRY